MTSVLSSAERVLCCRQQLAHAWMVRTFVKHSDEAEEFTELTELPRTVFDVCRALEPLTDQPDEYLRVLRKKLRKLRAATEQFAHDAPLASTHTNFEQAIASMRAATESLERLARDPLTQSASDAALTANEGLHPLSSAQQTP